MTHWTQRRRLGTVLAFNLALIAGLIIAGLLSRSVSVLASAGDTAADAIGLILGLIAVTIRDRSAVPVNDGGTVIDRPGSRATTLVAILNGVMLLVVTGIIVAESIMRLVAGAPEVRGGPMVIVSLISAAVLLLGAWVLGRGAAEEDLHMRSVLLDTLADAASALAVAATGVIIIATGRLYWLDPAVALAIGLVVAFAATKLIRDGVRVLRGEEVEFDDD